MPLRTDGPAPYAPPSTVLGLIQIFRDRGLTTPFTAEVLIRAGVSEALAPRTLLSLRHLDLLDEQGQPTPALEGLRRAPQTDFRTRLEEVVRSVYAEVFQFTDPAKDPTERISDAFRPYTPPGQRARMVTLFLGLCEAAGIIAEGAKPTVSAGRQHRAAASPRAGARRSSNGDESRPASVSAKAPIRNDIGGLIPQALTGLLASLPSEGGRWTQERRNQFVATFETVLDFCYPIGTEIDQHDDDE